MVHRQLRQPVLLLNPQRLPPNPELHSAALLAPIFSNPRWRTPITVLAVGTISHHLMVEALITSMDIAAKVRHRPREVMVHRHQPWVVMVHRLLMVATLKPPHRPQQSHTVMLIVARSKMWPPVLQLLQLYLELLQYRWQELRGRSLHQSPAFATRR